MNTHDTIPKARMMIVDSDLLELHNKPDGEVTEEDLKTVLRRYNLRDGLITLGQASSYIFSSEDPNNIGRAAYREPLTRVIISQFALAYLANILLISGANDYKSKYLGERGKDNWLILCNIYSNKLVQPELKKNFGGMDKNKLLSTMIRMYFEQMMPYQFDSVSLISRTIVLFNDIAERINPTKFKKLTEIFQNQTGLTIYDYLRLSMAIWAGAQKTATFRMDMFTQAKITQMKDILTEEKFKQFLDILKADYKKFRDVDANSNQKLNPDLTKTRFNPFHLYPIIETDTNNFGDPFVVPNFTCYAKKVFGGLYWWFHRYFEGQKKQLDFRNYFGDVFQEYVGIVLKNVFGEKNVHPEVLYDGNKTFIDWWVERNDKIYLFEAKANQFSLASMQTGDIEIIINGEIKKVADAVEQVYKRILDIPRYKELGMFLKKKVIPFIVFMDMPFISCDMYEELICEALEKRQKENTLTGLKDFPRNLLNIEELELFDGVVGKIELEDVFPAIKKDMREGFLSIVSKAKKSNLKNTFLDKIYGDFWKTIGISQDK